MVCQTVSEQCNVTTMFPLEFVTHWL